MYIYVNLIIINFMIIRLMNHVFELFKNLKIKNKNYEFFFGIIT
jgi:hypothetical protein